MQDQTDMVPGTERRLDARILRHMMLETIDLLDLSSDHAAEACDSTDAAMALTRIDWMLMGVFNWLTRQLRTDTISPNEADQPVGEPVSIIGIDMDSISQELHDYVQIVDRLHARARHLESLIAATARTRAETSAPAATIKSSGLVLHIFGDPVPGADVQNPVLDTRRRLNSAFGGN